MIECKFVVGKNFGDEGKGLMSAYFASKACNKSLIIKHNGGAQAGHTVENGNKRFVFHQYGSGSMDGGATLLTDTFYIDLIKIEEERRELSKCLMNDAPKVYAMENCFLTTIYDVIVNSLIETVRRDERHGSCGMGIYEAVLRSKYPQFALQISDLEAYSISSLISKLRIIRDVYFTQRLREAGITKPYSNECTEWISLFEDDAVLENAAVRMLNNLKACVNVVRSDTASVRNLLDSYELVVFESAQGLLLDCDRIEYYPHLTPSKTGSTNALLFLKKYGYIDAGNCLMVPGEVCYVSRSYVTRHGAGKLMHECSAKDICDEMTDETNRPNPWQNMLRYAKHENAKDFLAAINEDLIKMPQGVNAAICFTHLNETSGKIILSEGNAAVDEIIKEVGKLTKEWNVTPIECFYTSYSKNYADTEFWRNKVK